MLKHLNTTISALIVFLLTMSMQLIILPAANAGKVYQSGTASYYGKYHHGRKTASGKPFNMHAMTAAHRTLPFGTKLRVTCKSTGKSVIVTVTDRGPYHGGRILDLSQGAAKRLGFIKRGVGKVSIVRLTREVKQPLKKILGVTEKVNAITDKTDSIEILIRELSV